MPIPKEQEPQVVGNRLGETLSEQQARYAETALQRACMYTDTQPKITQQSEVAKDKR